MLATFTITEIVATINITAPILQSANKLWSKILDGLFASSTKNEAVTRVRKFSAIRRFPADDPFKQPPTEQKLL